jgi:hypothetical protein
MRFFFSFFPRQAVKNLIFLRYSSWQIANDMLHLAHLKSYPWLTHVRGLSMRLASSLSSRFASLAQVILGRTKTSRVCRRHTCRPRLEELEPRTLLNAPGTGWNPVFSDDFSGSAIDASKWTTYLPWGGPEGNGRFHNSNYLSYIMDDDVVVSNGSLKLLTEHRNVVGPGTGHVYNYTEGLIQTSGKFSFAYGYAEIRAKVPTGVGNGIWPAFWMLGNGWPPEMDIAEWLTSGNNFHQGLYGMDSQWRTRMSP